MYAVSVSFSLIHSVRFAEKRNEVLHIVADTSVPHKPTSSGDWPYRVFNEQLQRIAGQLSATIEGVIHGDQFVILDQFSKAWDRFLYVYKDLIKNLTNLSLEKDPEEEAEALANQRAGPSSNSGTPAGNRMLIVKYSNPKTDFRVLGIQVFTDHIGAKYQQQM